MCTQITQPTIHAEEHSGNRSNNMASIADIESALERFTEDCVMGPTEWFLQYEAAVELGGLNAAQKYLFCRRMMAGAAKLAMEENVEIKTYDDLKRYIVDCFGEEQLQVHVHRDLQRQKKAPNESTMTFIFRMKKLASAGHVQEQSLLVYIIEKLPGSDAEKFVLEQAKTFVELRQMLLNWDRRRAEIDARRAANAATTEKNLKTQANGFAQASGAEKPAGTLGPGQTAARVESRSCYVCGESGHLAHDCAKATPCPKCKQMGHSASRCPIKTEAIA